MSGRWSVESRRARLGARHLLDAGAEATAVDQVADALVALHSSDPVTVYLSVARRMHTASPAAIDAALYDDRTVLRHHAMRRTLWVMTVEVARVAHAACSADLVRTQRRALSKLLAGEGIDRPDEWIDEAIAATLAELERLPNATTRELGEAVPALRLPLEYASDKPYGGTIAAHTRVLVLIGFTGAIVRGRPVGSWLSGQYRWNETERWVPRGLASHREMASARADLVDRYLRAFGPVSAEDVRWWTGWTKRATTTALADARAETVEVDRVDLLVATGDADIDAGHEREPWVALLPGLDPTTMGWKERDWYIEPDHVGELFDRNGNAGPTVWADGRVVGGWMQRSDGEIAVELLTQVDDEHRRLLDAEIARLTRFVGDVRFTLRFPTPSSRRLTA